jgi:FAD/FMN-containing dehydrogenase
MGLTSDLRSWGLPGPFRHETIDLGASRIDWRRLDKSVLAYGNGRSYGDSCINDGQSLLLTRRLDRYQSFDEATGVLECDTGVMLSDIIRDFLPRGWFLPVTPGTRFITVGGAIANDVHGKNHHIAGAFGDHVDSILLERSDGSILNCSAHENSELFRATIGGLGLTGLIRSAAIRLRQVENGWMKVHEQRFASLDEFFLIDERAESTHEYTVAWIDCAARGAHLGRGVYLAANHAETGDIGNRPQMPAASRLRTIPVTPPISLVNRYSLRVFNEAYWRRAAARREFLQPLMSFFYPLDSLLEWNRIYGPKGFFQYQCVLVHDARATIKKILGEIACSSQGSFLAVLKTFGDRRAPGMLSFPRPGITLALDFPNRGRDTHALFERLDHLVQSACGALYPAKDARMPSALFRSGYPAVGDFGHWKDPRFSSSFWRRVMESQ